MTSQEFVYWLQGHLELSNVDTLDARQVQIIKDHIALVLHKVTPERKDADSYPPFGSIPSLPGVWRNNPVKLCDARDLDCRVTCDVDSDKVVDAVRSRVAEMSHSMVAAINGWGQGGNRLTPLLGWTPEGSC